MKNKSLEKFFNFKNKVVLITGCNGQIGTSIVDFFIDSQSKVYGIDIIKKKIKEKFNIL